VVFTVDATVATAIVIDVQRSDYSCYNTLCDNSKLLQMFS